jgi:hypothetical protein
MASAPIRAGRIARCAGALAVVLLLAACASDDAGGSTTSVTSAATSTAPATTAVFAPAEETTDADGSTDRAADASSDATAPIDAVATSADGPAAEETALPTVPETGVPGIDSSDAFCRAWSEFGGTFQGLAISWGVGDPADAARNEVAAAGAILRAVDELDANLPTELEAERADLMALVGPLSQRAATARDALLAAGVTDDGVTALADAWIDTLVQAGTDDPSIVVSLPGSIDAASVDAAAAAFADERPPLGQDPALTTDAETPQTTRYLQNCPDQGTLLGNDDVGSAP